MGIVRDIISFLDILGDDVRGSFRDAGMTEETIGEELEQAICSPHTLAEIRRRNDPAGIAHAIESTEDAMTFLAGLSYLCSAGRCWRSPQTWLQLSP